MSEAETTAPVVPDEVTKGKTEETKADAEKAPVASTTGGGKEEAEEAEGSIENEEDELDDMEENEMDVGEEDGWGEEDAFEEVDEDADAADEAIEEMAEDELDEALADNDEPEAKKQKTE